MQNNIGTLKSNSKLKMIIAIEIAAVLALWQFLSSANLINDYLSNPIEIGTFLLQSIFGGELIIDAGMSLYRSLTGFILVIVCGTILGICAGYFQPVGRFFDPLISLGNPVPKVALLPVLIVWFGLNDFTRIFIIFLTAFFPCFINTADGVRTVNKYLIWSARNMGSSHLNVVKKIIFPAALPKIFDGYRISLALTFMMVFSSEIIGSANDRGLGLMILNADMFGRTDIMFAAVFVIALLGLWCDRILLFTRSRILWWAN
ncbi:ABC transporter permease [Salicibibacter cibarius]|uniref:ABC transporter permease n=1 Tax=Salicibibacter cibarius TaxID=2743000 RepID=A0A7T6Z0J1_9BACI|nr:ABC transporter permease [Salicibibacter cibarius]QQK74442.1 ABC transporter permease [Salicibibacter cibarius]